MIGLEEFRKMLFERLRIDSSTNETSESIEFLNYLSELLIESNEIDEPIISLQFEGVGRRRRKIKIDGYTYVKNELDGYLALYIIAPLNSKREIESLTSTDAERYFGQAQAFIEDAKEIVNNAEESAPAYGLAVDIDRDRQNIEREGKSNNILQYRIYLLTDNLASKSMRYKESSQVNGINIQYHIYDIQRVYQIENSKTGKEPLIINLDNDEYQNFKIKYVCANETQEYSSYLCSCPGIILAKLYKKYGGRLLEGNVRSFLQIKGKVNKGIRNTIINDGENFFAYNNGITVTASSMKTATIGEDDYISEITDLQIVNGGQTTASLANCLINDTKYDSENKIKNIFVPMKLSILSKEVGQRLIPLIAEYANTQNRVSVADLASNHPFHIVMEEFSRKIVAPSTAEHPKGSYWYYERAHGQYKQETYKATDAERKRFEQFHPKNQMFDKTDLGKIYNTYKEKPHLASLGGQKSFAEFSKVIEPAWKANKAIFNASFFRFIIALLIIFRATDKSFKNKYHSYKINVVEYTLAKIFKTVHEQFPDKTIDFPNIWRRQTISEAFLQEIQLVSGLMYNNVLINEARTIENVTEWAKKNDCWEMAQKVQVKLTADFCRELIDKDIVEQQEKAARKYQKDILKDKKMIEVANYGLKKWKELVEWNKLSHSLSPTDMSFINIAIRALENSANKFPSEKQCNIILEVLDKAIEEGFPK